MNHFEDLESKLSDLKLNNLPATESTILIKKFFSDLFNKEPRYIIYANRIGKNAYDYVDEESEYLYDLTVIEQETSNIHYPFLKRTVLVLESEWGNLNEILYDFQKLLMSNSKNKVMVFQSYHLEDFEMILNYMKANIEQYEYSKGDYFLCCFINYKNKFKVKHLHLE